MKIVVYVEGAGDRLCLETLLDPLLRAKAASGVQVRFVEMTRGDRKVSLLTQTPIKAANTVLNDPEIGIVILPDLYPPNKGFDHTTCEEMQDGVLHLFRRAVSRKREWDTRLEERFQVFCLIHDLEALLLAAEERLMEETGITSVTWRIPVEEQNHHRPPKRIVQELIPGYQATVDGRRILANVDYHKISARCPRGFGQFVAFLESVG